MINRVKITVLICTYNRGNLINDTLQSLIEGQTRMSDQIVVVNGGGEYDCQSTLDHWSEKFIGLKVVSTVNKNLSVSRNIGLDYCDGDLILQTDDDARVFPDWVERLEKAHSSYPKAGVIGGDVVDSDGKTFLSQIADAATFPHYDDMRKVRSVPGVNSSYKRKVIKDVGKYDEELFRGEDVDYNWRAIKSGWDVLYMPDIKVLHVHRPTWKGLFYQHYMYGKAHYLVRNKWPDMYSSYPLKVHSFYHLLKLIRSWILAPLDDAYLKSKMIIPKRRIISFLILWLISLNFRIGSRVQQYITNRNI